MRILEELSQNFSNSKPRFIMSVNKDYISLEDTINKYTPPTDTPDVLQNVVNQSYRESFDFKTEKFTYSAVCIAKNTYYAIIRDMCAFLKSNLECKAPTHTKLYKYVNWIEYSNAQQSESLILLWKYIKPFALNDKFHIDSINKVHTNNAISILEAMKDKYEK
jgi:hypothetical protein